MNGIEKIKSKIMDDAKADAENILRTAGKHCEEIEAEYDLKTQKIRDELVEKTEKRAENIINRAKAEAAVDKRNAELMLRSSILDEAFDRAKKSLLSVPGDRYADFLSFLACSAVNEISRERKRNKELYDEKDLEGLDGIGLVMNASDHAMYGKRVVENAKKKLRGKTDPEIIEKIVLSDDTADIEGGLIARYGDVEINCSIDVLMTETRREIEGEICRLLFG